MEALASNYVPLTYVYSAYVGGGRATVPCSAGFQPVTSRRRLLGLRRISARTQAI